MRPNAEKITFSAISDRISISGRVLNGMPYGAPPVRTTALRRTGPPVYGGPQAVRWLAA
jgi:hypothetical protein